MRFTSNLWFLESGSRIDAVVISADVVFVLEFKVAQTRFLRADLEQAWDYALDLKNFHLASHSARVIPILIATEAPESDPHLSKPYNDWVYPPLRANAVGLRQLILAGLANQRGLPLDPIEWADSPYFPTPTIVEAAQALFAGQSVEAISRTEAGPLDLQETTRTIEQVIAHAQKLRRKSIVLLTGVPGAGKTLVGLNSRLGSRIRLSQRMPYTSLGMDRW